MLATEYDFELPRGYIDRQGNLHKRGVMRLATAIDEILPLNDPRVIQNNGYLTIIILTRVITKLGSLPSLDTSVIEGLFFSDLNYLQDLYQRINSYGDSAYRIKCPHCQQQIEIPLNFFEQDR